MMSSTDSMPTLRRTRPAIDRRRRLLLGGELAVGGARRMDHQAAHVADVGDVAVQFGALDELLAGFEAALDLERQHRSVTPAAAELGGPLVPRARCETRVVDGFDLIVSVEVLGHLLRVGEVTLHAQAQRLEALQDQERVERRDRKAEVAQHLHASLEDERAVAERREVGEAVVAGVGLGEVREATGRGVVERAAVDDRAADRRAVAADELGEAVDHDVGAPLERTDQVRRGHRVVDHQRDAVGVGDAGDALDVEHVVLRVRDDLAEEHLGVRLDRRFPLRRGRRGRRRR